MKSLQEQIAGLDDVLSARLGGTAVSLQPIPGSVPVIQVVIGGREELPIFITASETQVLCICYLWSDEEVRADKRAELLETLLALNPSIPLSAFGRIDKRFVLFGALASDARVEDVAQDVIALSDNALDALEALSAYLV
ncbi:DUF2170 family protein [Pseudothauera lacus]|uniref:DUF2170 domain-containing protein n=1 Tax=Pseudothauera lacus TaxID=2136175 RepID=A0A2T4IJY8_9RHOO|nr:DUF2170 family protein [Pseudothauera lacus]PTD98077.1 DUF2170 domain-containing protein [Pseudothauera lacus]